MWSIPPNQLAITKDTIHIWQADLNIDKKAQKKFLETLNAEEHIKANRYRFEKDRIQYIAGRGILRQLLSRYLSIHPKSIVFEYNKYGKPHLEYSDLQFNISHSGGVGVFGFTEKHLIGVDVELIKPDMDLLNVAEHFFAKKEIEQLLSLPSNRQCEGFFNCWTRKEAIIKAIGHGLSFPLNDFQVSLLPEHPAQLLATYWDEKEVENWSLQSFEPKPNYIGALALRNKRKRVQYFIY